MLERMLRSMYTGVRLVLPGRIYVYSCEVLMLMISMMMMTTTRKRRMLIQVRPVLQNGRKCLKSIFRMTCAIVRSVQVLSHKFVRLQHSLFTDADILIVQKGSQGYHLDLHLQC